VMTPDRSQDPEWQKSGIPEVGGPAPAAPGAGKCGCMRYVVSPRFFSFENVHIDGKRVLICETPAHRGGSQSVNLAGFHEQPQIHVDR
jgi:hypothetical protein